MPWNLNRARKPSSTASSASRRRSASPGSVGQPEHKVQSMGLSGRAASCLLFAAALSSTSYAQPAPKRLSEWLLERPDSADAYLLGLSWRVPEERAAQALSRTQLIA